ncbi:MAG: ATP-binding cassette domain-containing protein [Deltaproteobacteria bacterium]|nr:ATP-binding cassette domain-containing protein [Deltaproteobacteria bacterium]
MSLPAIDIRGLDFRYASDPRPVLHQVSLNLAKGSRCLLVGANGAGKTTLLHVVAGRHLVPVEKVRVLGRPAFHDTTLSAVVSFIGGPFPFDVDVRVADILTRTPGIDPARRTRLLDILAVDPEWHMHRVSDGQRRRVQVLLGLLRPPELLLLDEVTTDLDVIARSDLLALLKEESITRQATVLYATHIFDGLNEWATHLAFMDGGRVVFTKTIADIRQQHGSATLLPIVESWIRRR